MFFNEKKSHFKKRLKGIRLALYDIYFQKHKAKEVREGFRFEHDKIAEQQQLLALRVSLIERYGVELAEKLQKAGPDVANDSLREGEQELVALRIGIPKLEPLKELSEGDKDLLEKLKKDKEPLDADLKQLRDQMDAIDQQIEGLGGYDEKIQGLIELKKMLEGYIKEI